MWLTDNILLIHVNDYRNEDNSCSWIREKRALVKHSFKRNLFLKSNIINDVFGRRCYDNHCWSALIRSLSWQPKTIANTLSTKIVVEYYIFTYCFFLFDNVVEVTPDQKFVTKGFCTLSNCSWTVLSPAH